MPLFILVILVVVFISNVVIGLAADSILGHLYVPGTINAVIWGVLGLQIFSMLLFIGARVLGYQPGTGMGRPLISLCMIWNLLLALPTAVVFSIWALAWYLLEVGNFENAWRTVDLLLVAFPFAASFVATAIAVRQLDHFRIRRFTLTIPNLPSSLKGLTIAHLSDLHLGKLTKGKVLDDIVAATNRLDTDLILVTGDIINMALEDLPTALEMLRRMKSRHGLYLCEGNHDLIENRRKFEALVKTSDIPFLLNQAVNLNLHGHPVQIMGLRWGEGMGEEPDVVLNYLLEKREPGAITILLAHHPDAFDAAARAGIPLTLSGHTHGGQLMISDAIGFGPWLYRYWSGLYQQGASQMIVSNGVGNWFPLRINVPAEIIHITLE